MGGGGRAVERLRMLIEQVRADMPGAKEHEVAQRLGLSESHYSKIKRGKPTIYVETIEGVIAAMRLDPRFFFDADIGEAPHYRDFIRRRPAPSSKIVPHWDEFAREWPRFGELTREEREAIPELISDLHTIAHWSDWIAPAQWVLSLRER